jgi:hypothetical protein
MPDDTGYVENIRKLTTAAEKDDAVTAGKLLSDLGPEHWSRAVKDMLALNQKDIKDNFDSKNYAVFIPQLSAEMDKAGTTETLTVFQQPSYAMKAPLPVAKITEDIVGRKVENPVDPKGDVVRQLTTAAEDGNAVAVARILRTLGPEKWADTSNAMLKLNMQDRIQYRKDHPDDVLYVPPYLSVGYERSGRNETIEIFQAPDSQTDLPLAKVTDSKF